MLSYADALRAIFRRTDYERGDRPERPAYAERVWRLDRVRELLAALGNPQQAYRAVHVAGTKGKGSTTAMIESALRAGGYRTGMYTSPHLHTFRERIRRDGAPIPEADVVRLVERLRPVLAVRPEVTVFEIITAMAMLYMSEEPVDFGVFEVGLGGRLDATNILEPEVAVITSISLDHTKIWATPSSDRRRKGRHHQARRAGGQRAAVARGAGGHRGQGGRSGGALTLVGGDWRWRALGADLTGQCLAIYRAGHERAPEYERLEIPSSAPTSWRTPPPPLPPSRCSARAAGPRSRGDPPRPRRGLLARAARDPLAETPRRGGWGAQPLLHGAADRGGGRAPALRAAAPRLWRRGDPPAGGDAAGALARHRRGVHGALPARQGHPGGGFGGRRRRTRAGGRPAGTVAEGLRAALAEARPEDLVLVTGSLFVVAEAREAWAALRGLPLPATDPPDVY